MDRSVSDLNILEKFAINFAKVIEKYCRYIIVSGFVAIAHGRTRGTEDIDMIIEKVDKQTFQLIHNDLIAAGFECLQGPDSSELYDQYLYPNTNIRYIKKGELVPEMELKLAKDKLDEIQLQERTKLPLTNLPLWFSSIEVNIAYKEEYLKSPKDLEDAEHLRIIYQGQLSVEKIKYWQKLIHQWRP
jgi:hypothetical protein